MNDVKKSDLFKVPFANLRLVEGLNIRADYGDIQQLAESIKINGLKVPLSGYRQGEEFFIVDGHRRYQALTILHEQGVDVIAPFLLEQRGTNEEQRIINMVLSNEGKPLNPLELAEGVRRLLAYGWSQKDIASKMAMSPAYVNRLNLLNTAPKKFIKLIASGEISSSLALQVIGEEKVEEFMQKYESGEIIQVHANGKQKKITAKTLQPINSWKAFKKFTTEANPEEMDEPTKVVYDFFLRVSLNEVTPEEFKAFFFGVLEEA